MRWTPPNQICQFHKDLHAGKTILTLSPWCKTQQSVLSSEPQEYAVVIPTKYNDPHSSDECINTFIQVIKSTNKMYIVPGGSIVAPPHLVRNNAASDRIDSVWLVNNQVDLDVELIGTTDITMRRTMR